MFLDVNPISFPYPTQFILASRAADKQAPPVQPLGVLIAKQTVLTDGSMAEKQEEILMSDMEYEKSEIESEEPPLAIHLESDLVAIKPTLDLVAVRDTSQPGHFGTVRIKRQSENNFGETMTLNYGWRSRSEAPRSELIGDVVNFQANPNQPFALPEGFQNQFFNGSHLDNLPHLQTGDIVEYQYQEENNSDRHQVFLLTIPANPNLAIKINGSPISPPVSINLGVDTVVYDFLAQNPEQSGKFLITWRAIFNWEDRLANEPNATLEVS